MQALVLLKSSVSYVSLRSSWCTDSKQQYGLLPGAFGELSWLVRTVWGSQLLQLRALMVLPGVQVDAIETMQLNWNPCDTVHARLPSAGSVLCEHGGMIC